VTSSSRFNRDDPARLIRRGHCSYGRPRSDDAEREGDTRAKSAGFFHASTTRVGHSPGAAWLFRYSRLTGPAVKAERHNQLIGCRLDP
jgi:hypothetical protein